MTSLSIVCFQITAHQYLLTEIGLTDFEEFIALIVLLHYLFVAGTTTACLCLLDISQTLTYDARTGSGFTALVCRLTLGFTYHQRRLSNNERSYILLTPVVRD